MVISPIIISIFNLIPTQDPPTPLGVITHPSSSATDNYVMYANEKRERRDKTRFTLKTKDVIVWSTMEFQSNRISGSFSWITCRWGGWLQSAKSKRQPLYGDMETTIISRVPLLYVTIDWCITESAITGCGFLKDLRFIGNEYGWEICWGSI